MRFHAEQHLRRPADISAVRERGQRVDCRAFTLWWKRREPVAVTAPAPTRARVCVIASTKAVGGAIQRNRAKRRLREVFRLQQAHVPADCDLLMIARLSATTWPLPELEKRFVDACRAMTAVSAP
jgi:ribonuclease P protein component